MNKAENTKILPGEIEKQREIIKRLRRWNDSQYHYSQRRRLALVVTYGCQQNESDSEHIRGILGEAGFDFCDSAADANLIIYNTCAVREGAEQRVFGNLGALKHEKQKRPGLIIGICGCMVQQEHITKQIKQKYKHVDIIFGTHTLYRLPQLLWEAVSERRMAVSVGHTGGMIAEDLPVRREGGVKACVSVMYGCNNFCSYCVVPYVRGAERSRKPDDILKELRQIAEEGYKEVMLLGQNVNSYGKDLGGAADFSDLLGLAAEVEGIERIRFMTSHPKDFNDKLIKTMACCPKICSQLHLPVQAGSDKVLRDMNRGYTRADYLEKISKVRSMMPEMAVTSDIIVGFPTETAEDFEQTLSLLQEVRFDSVYSFIYSKRTGTVAESLAPVLADKVVHANFDRLLAVQNQISKEINDSYLGKVYEVLVEGESKKDPSTLTGRTSSGKIVNFTGAPDMAGKTVSVKITAAQTWSLFGEVQQ